ncbi:YhjD/YihY/BrkB family envelope integrity protein [Micromonospora sp. NBC_01813]|uniref:YhjD/YihY/BrkB family envelope integrity protein n=1 Tax=Micromonospora sp. NBC_01813 TaxID=2975988 RepID=UPI002DDAB76C|nr:YhjD/YihY/BrkB family envelope integrity protein [Micromonospora sp. NBC_01813]WSA11782.1 YihY/virulence factor BrkB family protein [Micromonospora sp. NBC_01813]
MVTRGRRLVRAAFRPLRGQDLSLHAASITFFGAIAVVPVVLLAIWLTGLFAGADRVRRLTDPAIDTLPGQIGADRAAAALIDAGLHLTPLLALAALLPASLYGEGLRRAFVSVAPPPEPAESMVGWRGRVLLLPLLGAAPALMLLVLLALPSAAGLFVRGGWAGALGVVVSFLAVWLGLSPVLVWVYRVVGPGKPDWLATVAVGSFTAANLAGFLHGFILFCSLPLDLGLPFGGLDQVGAAVAVLLWLYLLHVIVLAGYSATLVFSRWRQRRRPVNQPEGRPAGPPTPAAATAVPRADRTGGKAGPTDPAPTSSTGPAAA